MLRFEQVTKGYSGGFVALDRVSFELEKGEMAFLTGHSGAGKSTLLRLISLIERPSAGRVFINGVDLSKIRQRQVPYIRRDIGMIFQNFNLLNSKTVFHNIAIPLILQRRDKAFIQARVAELLAFVDLSDKMHSYPNELSGGQKQRVGIARALATNPSVLLCDEATSALDTESERKIQSALDELLKGRTSLVIAHRLSTIEQADLILVMDQGKIVERGNHQQLLALDGYYAQLYKMQFSEA